MHSNNLFLKSKVKNIWRSVAVAVFAVCFALLGLGVTVLPAKATDNRGYVVGEIYQVPTNVQHLYALITGKADATYADVVTAAEANADVATMRAYNDDHDIKVTFGGQEWYAVYLSQTDETNPRPILTLWLAEAFTTDIFNYDTSSTYSGSRNAYPNAMYGTSYVRTKVLNNAGQYSTNNGQTLNNTVTPDANHPLARFSVPTVDGALTDFIVKPALVAWQRAGQLGHGMGVTAWRFKNENWGEESVTGWCNDEHNYSEIDGYGAWQDDYLWLPSYYEYDELWQSKLTISETDGEYWSRSGDTNTHRYANKIGNLVDVKYTTVDTEVGIRPALHLDLQMLNAMTDFITHELPASDVTYDGTAQNFENWANKPTWYNDAMQISYTQNGAEVTTVQTVGEYSVKVQWGEVQRTTTLTIAPREVTVDETTIKAVDRTYNGERKVELAEIKINGVIMTDVVALAKDGIMDDKNAGEKNVKVTLSLTGADAKNYVLANTQFTTTVNITKKTVTVSGITATEKEYDGTAQAFLSTSKLDYEGLHDGDDLTVLVSGEYVNAENEPQTTVGDDFTIKLTYSGLNGADADNYTISASSQSVIAHAKIKRRVITVTIADQTVKVDAPQKTLTARVSSGSLASGDTDEMVYALSIVVPTDPENPDAEIAYDHLPVGEYAITGTAVDTDNYTITFVDGKYTVLTAEAWDALQDKDADKGDQTWLIIVIVVAVFIGALIGVGLVIRIGFATRNHDKQPARQPKQKQSK